MYTDNLIYDDDGYVTAEVNYINGKEVVFFPAFPCKKQNTFEHKPSISKIIKDSSVFEEGLWCKN